MVSQVVFDHNDRHFAFQFQTQQVKLLQIVAFDSLAGWTVILHDVSDKSIDLVSFLFAVFARWRLWLLDCGLDVLAGWVLNGVGLCSAYRRVHFHARGQFFSQLGQESSYFLFHNHVKLFCSSQNHHFFVSIALFICSEQLFNDSFDYELISDFNLAQFQFAFVHHDLSFQLFDFSLQLTEFLSVALHVELHSLTFGFECTDQFS